MNWEAIGAIGEVIGAVGVIGTLAYLAVQIGQNSKVVRSATRQAVSSEQRQVGYQIIVDPEVREAAKYWSNVEDSPAADAQFRNEMFIGVYYGCLKTSTTRRRTARLKMIYGRAM